MKRTQVLSEIQPIAATGQRHSTNALQLFALARGRELRLLANRCAPHACLADRPRQRPRGPLAFAARGKE